MKATYLLSILAATSSSLAYLYITPGLNSSTPLIATAALDGYPAQIYGGFTGPGE
jgi:hypothetical protein